MSEKKKGGRPAGTNADVLEARRLLSGHLALKKKFDIQFILDALDVLMSTMKDPNANQATRVRCANDVMKLYFDLHGDSLQVVAEFEAGKTGKALGKPSKEESLPKEGTSGNVMRFTLATSKDKD